jgi:lipopolysaccharide export LptBFGC system permease protein LptF
MRTLHLYLTRQMLATLGMTVFVFTFVLLLGNVLKQIFRLLVNRQLTLGVACHSVLLLIPYVLAFALPIGMLTAALLVFGRFSADQELTAARASGISLISLISPVLLLSVAVSGLCAWLNFDIAPASRVAYLKLIFQATARDPANVLHSGEMVQLGDWTILAEKKDGTNLYGVKVAQFIGTTGEKCVEGPTGDFQSDSVHHRIILTLHSADSWILSQENGWLPQLNGGDATFPIPVDSEAQSILTVGISDMTCRHLPGGAPGSQTAYRGRDNAGAGVYAPHGGIFLCVHWFHAGGYSAGDTGAPSRDQCRRGDRLAADADILQFYRPGAGMGQPS